MSNPAWILTGVGRLYVAAVGTAFPAVSATPAGSWRDVGDTIDGVTVTPDQTVNGFGSDQRTGNVKARRSEESLQIETKLAQSTAENLADVLGSLVIDTPEGPGTIGTRMVRMTRSATVSEAAFLFKGNSPYGDWPAQYEVPRGYFGGAQAMEHTKDALTSIPVEFHALEDLNATSEDEKFGRLIEGDEDEAVPFILDLSLLDSTDYLT